MSSAGGVGEVPRACQILTAINKSLKGRAEKEKKKKSFGSKGGRAQPETRTATALSSISALGCRGPAGRAPGLGSPKQAASHPTTHGVARNRGICKTQPGAGAASTAPLPKPLPRAPLGAGIT